MFFSFLVIMKLIKTQLPFNLCKQAMESCEGKWERILIYALVELENFLILKIDFLVMGWDGSDGKIKN